MTALLVFLVAAMVGSDVLGLAWVLTPGLFPWPIAPAGVREVDGWLQIGATVLVGSMIGTSLINLPYIAYNVWRYR